MDDTFEAAPPLIDRIGARSVNIGLGAVYALFWLAGLVTLFLIVANANVSWPLALGFAYVIALCATHGAIVAIGRFFVPGYVFYPVKPRIMYMINDAVLFLCFVAVLASYLVNSTSSTVPLFALFALQISTSILLLKLYHIIFPASVGGVARVRRRGFRRTQLGTPFVPR